MMITSQYVAKNPDGKFIDIAIEVALPEPDPEIGGDSRCKLPIAALELEQYAFGVDDIQAYCLSSKLLQLRLIEKQNQGWQFYYHGCFFSLILFTITIREDWIVNQVWPIKNGHSRA